jgi:cyclohexa-1,5-dienecarbonyl-CoA hydratase
MSPYQHIDFAIEDRVARITFNNPPLNIFTIAMMREIGSALDACIAQRDLVAVLFNSSPESRGFSAGVAVEEHAADTVYQMLESFHAIFRTLENLSKPTIAVVDGAALGGGCELICACDIVIASDRAKFGQPEVKLGVFPPVAAVLLPRIVGERRARELILTGELIEAAEALKIGLINYVVPVVQLSQKSAEVVARFRELSASALELTRRSLDLGRGRSIDAALREVEDIYLHDLMKTADAVEGIEAFKSKRKPVWRNR